MNVISDATLSSNTANLYVVQTDGPLFPGMLVVGQTANLQTNVAVVQSFSNVSLGALSNVIVAFSNTANGYISGSFLTGNTVSLYQPLVSAQVASYTAQAVAATSTTLVVSGQVSQVGSSIQVGQYVAGLPITGPVYVSNVYYSNVIVSFPSQTVLSATIPSTLTIAFVGGTANTNTTYNSLQFQAWTNFVYLDQTERDWFAKAPQNDLLITQVQRVVLGTNPVQELALAQPVKFLAFPCVNYAQIYANGAGSLTASNYQLKTQVNGVDVGDSRALIHFCDVPQYYNTPWGYVHNNSTANVAIISYCLDTSKLQPTGTLNFSRLDTFRIVVPPTLPSGVLGLYNNSLPSAYPTPYLYAVNYNILRIQNGLGSILYAN